MAVMGESEAAATSSSPPSPGAEWTAPMTGALPLPGAPVSEGVGTGVVGASVGAVVGGSLGSGAGGAVVGGAVVGGAVTVGVGPGVPFSAYAEVATAVGSASSAAPRAADTAADTRARVLSKWFPPRDKRRPSGVPRERARDVRSL